MRLRIEREVLVPLPSSGDPCTLPPGDYVGYLHETGARLDSAELHLVDMAIIKKLGLGECVPPVNFEVSQLIKSGAIEVIDD